MGRVLIRYGAACASRASRLVLLIRFVVRRAATAQLGCAVHTWRQPAVGTVAGKRLESDVFLEADGRRDLTQCSH
jgi:hypothetical protein